MTYRLLWRRSSWSCGPSLPPLQWGPSQVAFEAKQLWEWISMLDQNRSWMTCLHLVELLLSIKDAETGGVSSSLSSRLSSSMAAASRWTSSARLPQLWWPAPDLRIDGSSPERDSERSLMTARGYAARAVRVMIEEKSKAAGCCCW